MSCDPERELYDAGVKFIASSTGERLFGWRRFRNSSNSPIPGQYVVTDEVKAMKPFVNAVYEIIVSHAEHFDMTQAVQGVFRLPLKHIMHLLEVLLSFLNTRVLIPIHEIGGPWETLCRYIMVRVGTTDFSKDYKCPELEETPEAKRKAPIPDMHRQLGKDAAYEKWLQKNSEWIRVVINPE